MNSNNFLAAELARLSIDDRLREARDHHTSAVASAPRTIFQTDRRSPTRT